jgi:hypothetical protein
LEVRAALNAGQQRLSGRAILGPLTVLWSCIAPTWFGGAVLLTRARLRRAAGALAGGMLFGAIWILKLRIDHLMGWWRSRFGETIDPLSISTLLFLIVVVTSAAYLLVSWRLARRFGWMGVAVFIVMVAVIVTAGNRLLFEILMQIMTV